MVTMGQALAGVRTRLDESTTRAWTDPEIRGWVNEAVAEISRRTEALENSSFINVSVGATEVPMPADCLRVSRLEWWVDDAGTRIIPLEIREKFAMDSVWAGGQKSTTGTPHYAAPFGYPPQLAFLLYPLPAVDGSVMVYYAQAAPTLATDTSDDASTLSIPTGWDDLIFDYATQCAQRRDGNPAWQDTRNVFEAKLQQMWTMVQFYHNQGGQITEDATGFDADDYGGWSY